MLLYEVLHSLQAEMAGKLMLTEEEPRDICAVVFGIERVLQSPRRR